MLRRGYCASVHAATVMSGGKTRRAVLKVLTLITSEASARQLLRSLGAAVVAAAESACICPVIGVTLHRGCVAIVSQRYDASVLSLIDKRYPSGMPPPLALHIAAAAAQALAMLHASGAVHGGLHPGNVLVNAVGSSPLAWEVALADAATGAPALLALSQRSGDAAEQQAGGELAGGQPIWLAVLRHAVQYMAPEQLAQWAGDAPGKPQPAADVCALGATLAHMLSGQPPGGRDAGCDGAAAAAAAVGAAQPPALPPTLAAKAPARLAALLAEMMHPRAAARPSAAQACTRLEALIAESTSAAANGVAHVGRVAHEAAPKPAVPAAAAPAAGVSATARFKAEKRRAVPMAARTMPAAPPMAPASPYLKLPTPDWRANLSGTAALRFKMASGTVAPRFLAEAKEMRISCGGASGLVSMLASPEDAVAEEAACALRCTAAEGLQDEVMRRNALPALVALLQRYSASQEVGFIQHVSSGEHAGNDEHAADALRSEPLAFQAAGVLLELAGGPTHDKRRSWRRSAIAACPGLLPAAGSLLRHASARVARVAAGLLASLAEGAQQRSAIRAAGCVAPLFAALLRAGLDVAAEAATALLALSGIGPCGGSAGGKGGGKALSTAAADATEAATSPEVSALLVEARGLPPWEAPSAAQIHSQILLLAKRKQARAAAPPRGTLPASARNPAAVVAATASLLLGQRLSAAGPSSPQVNCGPTLHSVLQCMYMYIDVPSCACLLARA